MPSLIAASLLTKMQYYKMFRRNILKKFELQSNRFGFEPEVTAKISRIKKNYICIL